MENIDKIITAIEEIIKPEPKVISIAVIEGKNNIVYSTENWDISKDIEELNFIWEELKTERISISGVEYIIL